MTTSHPLHTEASERRVTLSHEDARRQRWIEGGLIFAFWTFMAVLTATSRILDPRVTVVTDELVLRESLRAFTNYYFWALITPLIFWLSTRYSIERTNWRSRLGLHLGIAVLVAIVGDIFNDFTRAYILPSASTHVPPFNPLRDIMRMWFLNELFIYFAVLGAGFARDYFLRYRARQEQAIQLRAQAARLEAQLAEARLQTLRMQLNPHFLFNTLHAVSTLVERDPRGVRRMIARLSALLRYTLEGSSAQEVPLHEELQFLEGYLDIQQIRFQGRLDVSQHIAPDVLDALVPNLILQPLVENAIHHGIAPHAEAGRLEIRAWREAGRLVLVVRDDGPGLPSTAVPSWGVGLSNTAARLEHLYRDAQSLDVRNAEGGGLEVRITLPALREPMVAGLPREAV